MKGRPDSQEGAHVKGLSMACGLSAFDSFSVSLSFSLFCPAHKGFQRFEALEQSDWFSPSQAGAGLAPRQRFLFISILDKKVTWQLYCEYPSGRAEDKAELSHIEKVLFV